MFTGIVENKSLVLSITEGKVPCLTVVKPVSWKFKIGDSVAVDGVCLTVVKQTTDSLSFDVVPETLDRTTVKSFKKGRLVNLERPLRMGDDIGGHMVQGHVDTTMTVVDINKRGVSSEIIFTFPLKYKNLVIEKGSIAINGVSLTIARSDVESLTIALIPHTLEYTNLGNLSVGDEVNVEFDTSIHTLAQHKEK